MDLKKYVADIPDFPEPGILFRDVTPLLADKDAYRETVKIIARDHGKNRYIRCRRCPTTN